ncbi:RING finger protein 145-like isoform X1 [Eriocheir sinensis]|uniref:RING finger protein 145-like isoform X1 n=1 Tax=Eriocheir sinensis TaxID=95602 RepID=UPI0021C9CD09|nr:RING finger protein 145-like isoform X1 [Eriocheir sinensis]XP_050686089.1 RING finger protein 145-like isoform X1 [Eriocheir sinensis]
MPLPSPYRNPGRWRAVVFRQEVRHGTAGCLLSLILLAPLLVREWGLTPVVVGIVFYSGVIVPALTGYFSFAKLLLRVVRSLLAVFFALPSTASTNGYAHFRGWATSLGRWAAGAVRGVVVGVRFLLVGVVRACVVLPVALSVAVTLAIHETYMSLYGARITANQVVFFLMVQELVTPWAHLTSLYFLLFYTVLVYIHRALFGRHWAMRVQVGQSHDLARLAVWYIATRLGKGVAMSFVLVMFTLQFSHVEPDLTFISITFTYFILTQHKWTGEERIITWIRALRLPPLEEEEDFWVPLGALVLPLVMSAGVAVVVAPSRPWLVVVAAYTNLLVPGLVVAQRVAGRDSPHAAVLTACRKATPKELEDRPTCPVCLEELRQARVTPCLHLYHASCLASCLAHSSLCPLCKQHI